MIREPERSQYLPVWLRQYAPGQFRADLIAGITVGILLIPQGMAYALLAGLPPIYGLYAALVPLAAYALIGSSRHLSVGPTAVVSLMIASALAPLAEPETGSYLSFALLLSLCSGVILLLMSLCQAGRLIKWIAHPVLSGFTAAAAFLIGASQLRHLLGLNLPRSANFYETLTLVVAQLPNIHWPSFLLGIFSVCLMLGIRHWYRRFPVALLAVVLGVLTVWFFSLDNTGIRIVGSVPEGLPGVSIPNLSLANLKLLILPAFSIALIGFLESMAVGHTIARRMGDQLNNNRELFGLGLANIMGAFFHAFPTTGSFSRTALNADSGAETQMASLITVALIALTLLLLTPLFYYMPYPVLAAIIFVALRRLIHIGEAYRYFQWNRTALMLYSLTFVTTLGISIEAGLIIGILVSVGLKLLGRDT